MRLLSAMLCDLDFTMLASLLGCIYLANNNGMWIL